MSSSVFASSDAGVPDGPIEWGAAARARLGQVTTGDHAVVVSRPGGALVAALDGLGHGVEAARAADTAGQLVRAFAGADLIALVRRCHEALRPTRGAAISLARVCEHEETVTWLGIGSVEGRLVSGDPLAPGPKASLRLFRGTPGRELPGLATTTLAVRRGDMLLFATDGVGAGFADSLDVSGRPRAVAERVLAAHRKGTDDALVLAARYLGPRP